MNREKQAKDFRKSVIRLFLATFFLLFVYSVAIRPRARSFRATSPHQEGHLDYDGYGTSVDVTIIREVVKWLTTARF